VPARQKSTKLIFVTNYHFEAHPFQQIILHKTLDKKQEIPLHSTYQEKGNLCFVIRSGLVHLRFVNFSKQACLYVFSAESKHNPPPIT
jgi:hypothetical protein